LKKKEGKRVERSKTKQKKEENVWFKQ